MKVLRTNVNDAKGTGTMWDEMQRAKKNHMQTMQLRCSWCTSSPKQYNNVAIKNPFYTNFANLWLCKRCNLQLDKMPESCFPSISIVDTGDWNNYMTPMTQSWFQSSSSNLANVGILPLVYKKICGNKKGKSLIFPKTLGVSRNIRVFSWNLHFPKKIPGAFSRKSLYLQYFPKKIRGGSFVGKTE